MKLSVLLLIALVIPLAGYAQMNEAELNILLGSPQNEFRDNLDRIAIGLNGSLALAIPETPVQLGLELGVMTYGTDERTENFSPDIPEVQVEVVTDYDILTGHMFLRIEGPARTVIPYVDALAGFNYLFTQSRVRDIDDRFDEIASDTNFDDFAFSYGAGGGLKVPVYSSASGQVLINLKTRYLFGGEADYLQPGSIEVNNGVLTFDESTSETDLWTVHLGVAFKF